ncbi:MAG: 5-(carboxyamino)imidazole ribonucleotide synthase [Planctomycetaceae bacterium]
MDRRVVAPGGTIGMLGGGQLGRMFAIAAAQLGYRVIVFADQADCPAATVSWRTVVGELSDRQRLDEFAAQCDVVTLEFENLAVDAVAYLATKVPVYPTAEVLRIAQDRRVEKQTFADAGLAVTPFRVVQSHADLRQAIETLGLPVVLKTARDGYDGKGQWKIGPQEAADLSRFEIDRPMIAEAWIAHQRELSVLVARGHGGEVAVYPVFENEHRHHILDVTVCPARISDATQTEATALAIQAAEAISLVGLMCVEMFQGADDHLMINEVAPRPHNSGHLTIEACHTSQFEQQVRVVCGLPLGDTALRVPAAAMVNLMGDLWDQGEPDWQSVLSAEGLHLHLYDKRKAVRGRKMGHITATGSDASEVANRLVVIRDRLSAV